MIYTIKYLQYILSGFNIRKKWGAGWFANGTLWMFLGGRPKMGSPSILKLPFWKDLMLLTQASLVEYTKLASIQLVIRLVWNFLKKKEVIIYSSFKNYGKYNRTFFPMVTDARGDLCRTCSNFKHYIRGARILDTHNSEIRTI